MSGSYIGKDFGPGSFIATGSGGEYMDIYVGPSGGERRLYGKNVKSGETFKPLCDKQPDDELWIVAPGVDPATVTFALPSKI